MTMKVAVCDELPIVRDGLRAAIGDDPEIDVVASTDSGAAILRRAAAGGIDVVVTGLRLPGMSGIDLARLLEEARQGTGTVLLVKGDEEDVIADALHAGVRGLLTTDADRDELRAAIRAAALGDAALAPRIARRLVGWFRQSDLRPEVSLVDALGRLTAREREVLVLTARGCSATEIARALVIEVATVRTHLYRLQTKLSANDRAHLVSLAYRAGVMRSTGV